MIQQTNRLGSLLILTEDSGRDAHETIVYVVRRMLALVEPSLETHRLGFEPKDVEAQRRVNGTRWKSANPRDKADFVLVLRSIATKLGRDDGFVFFHLDGDRTWTQRFSNENEGRQGRLPMRGFAPTLPMVATPPARTSRNQTSLAKVGINFVDKRD